MAHFARVENNIVQQVIVVHNNSVNNLDFPDSEPIGKEFIASLGLDGEWVQTSYNNNFRNTFAGVGYTWNGTDFIGPEIVTPELEEVVNDNN